MNESTLLEVLDFEVDVSMVVKEEPKDLECSSELRNLQGELVFPNNDSNEVNEDEIIRGLEDILDGLGDDSNSPKIQDSAGSEAGEINDWSTKEQENQSGSEAGEIDKEEPFDVEEGEISENAEKKSVCRFFIRGRCYYGSQCQFLHVCDKVYKMFELPALSNGSKIAIVPSMPTQIPQHPMEEGSSWEKGLKTAKVMIQDSIKKRREDKEFETKKLYISPEIPRSTLVYSRKKEFKSKCRTSDEKAIRAEPVKDLMDKRERKKEKHSTLNKENSKSEYKWVDPWMRSNKKDPKTHTSKRKHKKRHYSLSSASSMEDIDINPKSAPKRRLPRKPISRDSCCRSYSKSRSRSRSSSKTHYSYHNHSRKNSPSYRKPKRRKIRSSSLEKWYKKEVSTARHSQSPSCSSLDSFKSYESSMTISSLSCSQTSSSSSSTNDHVSNPTKRDKKSLDSKVAGAFPRQRIAAASIENLQAYIRPVKQKGLNLKDASLKQKDLNLKDASLKQRDLNLKDDSLKQRDLNLKDSSLKQRYLNLKDASLKQRDLNLKDASLKQRDLNLKDPSLKQRDYLNLKDASLKQRVSPKHTQVTVPEVKPYIKPVVKQPPKKKNPALRELLRYTNIKPKAISVVSQTSNQQASKLQDLDSSTFDCKGFVTTNPRRNITLNLQTPKLLKQKTPGVQTKPSGAPELSNIEIISKKESLLKQLRLVEQAIAKKKNSY